MLYLVHSSFLRKETLFIIIKPSRSEVETKLQMLLVRQIVHSMDGWWEGESQFLFEFWRLSGPEAVELELETDLLASFLSLREHTWFSPTQSSSQHNFSMNSNNWKTFALIKCFSKLNTAGKDYQCNFNILFSAAISLIRSPIKSSQFSRQFRLTVTSCALFYWKYFCLNVSVHLSVSQIRYFENRTERRRRPLLDNLRIATNLILPTFTNIYFDHQSSFYLATYSLAILLGTTPYGITDFWSLNPKVISFESS